MSAVRQVDQGDPMLPVKKFDCCNIPGTLVIRRTPRLRQNKSIDMR